MQQNEFEKQVQNMMDGFTPHPSEAVWKNISSRIDTGKRKKRWFAFWLTAFLVVGAGGALLYNFSNKHNDIAKENIVVHDSVAGADKPAVTTPETVQLPTEQNAVGSNDKPVEASTPTYDLPLLTHRPYHQRINATALPKPETESLSKDIIPVQQIAANNSSNTGNILEEETVTATQNNFTDTVAAITTQPSNNTITMADTAVANSENTPTIAASKKVKTKYTLPRWQWGVSASYGGSDAVNGLVSSNKAALDYSTPGSIAPGAGDTSNRRQNVTHPYNASTSYQFGVAVEKKIMKNAFIASGLNFVHLSTTSETGKKVDTSLRLQASNGWDNSFSVAGYYQPDNALQHTNTYNFIELPVYFQQDIKPQNKFSFSYNAGFSIRQLISSDALIYDPNNNIYFSKNELLKKTQFQLAAGLNLKVNTGRNNALYIGPQFSYSISGMYKNNSAGSFHLMNYGVQAKFMFHKK